MTAAVDDVGTITATWTDPEGTEWALSDIDPDLGWFTRQGIGGWGARPYEFTLDPVPRGGDSVRFIRAQSAKLTWPLHIWGESHQLFIERYRALRRAFLMTVHRQLPGTLRVARPDGAREIECFYEDGWTGEPGENWLFANPTVTLFCPDGYWRDVAQTQETRSFSGFVDFLNPFPRISTSQVLGSTTISNPGDVTAWPVWTVNGPMSQLVATNNTTGQTFTLTYDLQADETITITTLQPTVRGPASENLAGSLNWPTAYLWPLLPGTNAVDFSAVGAGTGTAVTLSFYPRYEGA